MFDFPQKIFLNGVADAFVALPNEYKIILDKRVM